MTSNRPPGSTDDAEKDLTAPCDVASTGAECNSVTTQRAVPATANTANTFLTNALPFTLYRVPIPVRHRISRRSRP